MAISQPRAPPDAGVKGGNIHFRQNLNAKANIVLVLKNRSAEEQRIMNIGPFTLPLDPFIFLMSVVIALLAGRRAGRNRPDVESALSKSVLVGLVVARVSFVLRYLPAYGGDFLKMLDVRDIGFSALPGVVAGVLVLLGIMARRRNIWRPLSVGALAGLVAWTAASAAATHWQASPMVPAISLSNTHGTLQPLAPHDGKPLVVNLWATWCPPCQAEMPVFAEVQATDPRINLAFVNQGESRDTVDTFLFKLDLHLDNVLLDPQLDVARATGATAYPTTFFYDASGHLLDTHVGRFSRATLSATLERLYPTDAKRHPD
jgi:thiol-disulfide isomerase/thioredoxin